MGGGKLLIVVPCYNEEKVLSQTAPLFLEQLNKLIETKRVSQDSKVLFVNDGSSDKTWEMIQRLAQQDNHFAGISLSRNRGHQNAVLAGLMEAKDCCDITISIDCDGQDDISAMSEMVDRYHEGNEVVYGVRKERKTDTFLKRFTAESFYRLLSSMGAEVIFNHADYRLISSRVLQEFAHFGEVNLFLRGMVPLVGFKSASVFYDRNERMAGKSHYPLSKMLSLAFDGITSLSIRPVRIISGIGVVFSIGSFVGILWVLANLFAGNTVAGWASLLCSICFMGGLQLLCLGVIGEYIGKIYLETKRRPRYIISEKTTQSL